MDAKVETWQNASRGIVWVRKQDRFGNMKDEVIRPGMKFTIGPDDRVFNQDMAASQDLDVFKNGRLVPVRLIDSSEDAKEIAANPNLISEADMRELFSSHHKTFESRVNSITNVVALERMLSIAEEDDTDASVKQVSLLKERVAKLNPSSVVERSSSATGVPMPGTDRIDTGRPTSM